MSFYGFFRWIPVCLALALSACAGYDGRDLAPGVSSQADVVASMGVPAMRWKEADGREQLAYPRGPAGTQTFMVFLAPDGRLERIEKALEPERFALILPGRDMAGVLRLLGPVTHDEAYFEARDELVLSWLYCNSWNEETFFDVLFDGTTRLVRRTQQRPNFTGWDGSAPGCGH